jgi:hypothetical protein
MTDARLVSQGLSDEEEAGGSAVSWAAVLAGAFVASAFSIALVALGGAWASCPFRLGPITMRRRPRSEFSLLPG